MARKTLPFTKAMKQGRIANQTLNSLINQNPWVIHCSKDKLRKDNNGRISFSENSTVF
jgi:hypothetical protein